MWIMDFVDFDGQGKSEALLGFALSKSNRTTTLKKTT